MTRDEALALWDELESDSRVFLYDGGELVLKRRKHALVHDERKKSYSYFIRMLIYANVESKQLKALDEICSKHQCDYRLEKVENQLYLCIHSIPEYLRRCRNDQEQQEKR